ncbi:hypothetical protein BGZ57DRAFT_882789 [Hyaloscypha finlandica]|nr:hypothetical protein BGZ57DRAFT_882789 [Hyaloscypha finlandica]
MPCGNRDHEHPSWPQQGTHQFVIEACEKRCGWCIYRTGSANNLRVHANRHVKNETTLKGITIVKGKAGRKRVQMTRRRFPASGAPNENLSRSTSVGRSDEGMNPDDSDGGDFNPSPGFLPGCSESPAPSHPAPLEMGPKSRYPPLLSEYALVRQGNPPYDERHFTILKKAANASDKKLQATKAWENAQNPGENQHRDFSYLGEAALHGTEFRAGSAQDYQLTEGPRPQDSDTDEPAPEVIEIDPNTDDRLSHSRSPNNQNSTLGWPGSSGQNSETGAAHQNITSGPRLDRATLQELGYTQSEINEILAYLCSFTNPIDANHQPVLSTESINKIHKQILMPLFRKPSLDNFGVLVLNLFEDIYINNKIGCLRDLQRHLMSLAKAVAGSDLEYLRFSNALVLCIERTLGYFSDEVELLDNREKTRDYEDPYSEQYFIGLFAGIHLVAPDVRGAVTVAGKEDVWTCDYSWCLLRLNIRKEYLLVHLQEYHDEDVGCTDDEELASREVDTSFWRCSWCLIRNNSRNRWKCQDCNAHCEEIRIRARTTASDHRAGMGYDAPSSIPTCTSTTESPQTDIPIPRIGPRELQEQPSASRSQTSTGNVPDAALDFPATVPLGQAVARVGSERHPRRGQPHLVPTTALTQTVYLSQNTFPAPT